MPDINATNWIPVREDLESDPRVLSIAEAIAPHNRHYILGPSAHNLFGDPDAVTRDVLRDITLTGLLRVWAAFTHHTKDGVIHHATTIAHIDTIARLRGFGAAMVAVKWAKHDPDTHTITLPNFTEYNAPNKNGERKKTAAAQRQQRHRDKLKAESEAAAQNPPVTPIVTPSVTLPVTPPEEKSNVTPSISISLSKNSDSGKEESRGENPHAALNELEAMKVKINALSPRWKKFSRWNDAEEHILLANMPNLRAAEDQDFAMIAYWLRWAASPANTNAKEPVTVTASRAAIAERFPDYLERATRHWKQQGCPRLNPDGTKATAKVLPFVQPQPAEPELPPSANAAAFAGLLQSHGVKVTTKPPTTSATA